MIDHYACWEIKLCVKLSDKTGNLWAGFAFCRRTISVRWTSLLDVFLITLGNVLRSSKKQVPGSDLLWQPPPTCWSVQMWYLSRSFWGGATVQADYAMMMTESSRSDQWSECKKGSHVSWKFLESPGFFCVKFPGPGKSWKVLEFF